MSTTDVPARPRPPMFTSRGWRFAMLGMLTLLMFAPLMMISLVIEDRVSYRRAAVNEVSGQWGGPISIRGPMLVIPVERTEVRTVTENGEEREKEFIVRAEPVVLLPERLDVTADIVSQIRRRGIFDVPVYAMDLDMALGFDTSRVRDVIGSGETILWDKSRLTMLMPGTRSFSGEAVLKLGGVAVDLEPGTPFARHSGIQASLGDPRSLPEVSLTMGLNGARELSFAPVGRMTRADMTSDWPHPSFSGAFLPSEPAEISAEGFTAKWEIPHLARDAAQVSRGMSWSGADFGVRLYNPVDFYQKVQRAAKYGILFIALTFLTVFLMEKVSTRPVHAAQFVLIGIAQCVFFLLLLSLAEQIGFNVAYAAASAATVGLIGFYGASGLGLARRSWLLVGCLAGLYATVWLILQSTDYALLAGSVLAFVAVALVMILTRGDDWSARREPAAPVPA